MKRIVSLYARLLHTNPFFTKIASTAILVLAADLFSQTAIQRASVVDARRAIRSFFVGLVYTGPAQVLSFVLLEWLVGDGGWTAPLIKVLLSQLFIGPLVVLGFMIVNGALQRLPRASIEHSIKTKLVSVLRARLVFWSAAHGLIFQFVPADYRSLGASVATFFWSTYVSWMANDPSAAPDLYIRRVQKQRLK
ncbi:unnamed protein product [Ixodes hexagonus]